MADVPPATPPNLADLEKGGNPSFENDAAQTAANIPSQDSIDSAASDSKPLKAFSKWNVRIESLLSLEARGIERVAPNERHSVSTSRYVQMTLLWFSANVTANNLSLAFLGPIVYKLSFVDAALCSVFGSALGSLLCAYISTWGPRSGNRTMIIARYFMGYYPSKLCCLLNIVIMAGYGMIDCVIGGQILSAVADGHMTIIVGIIIVAIISLVVSVLGMSIFHLYERWAWIPQVLVLFVLIGASAGKYDTTYPSSGDSTTVTANRLTFFSLCLSAPVAWTPSAADYYVYYPENTSRWLTFFMTSLGLILASSIVDLIGVGLASACISNSAFESAYNTSSGNLILQGYRAANLENFGKFCCVIIALGVIANNIPGTYSAALGIQVMGRYPKRVPRWILTIAVVIVYLACALGGRNSLSEIFENFLALMGYWVTIFICIVAEEHFIFHRNREYDWTVWEDPKKLPVGIAALAAFLIGWAGAIVCMDQVYYVGPIAKLVGAEGADLGIWVGSAWTLIVFPPMRMLELKYIGR
ncbi:MAG: hypothetical protein M1834_001156 [Cirrosporium novae-zelandiae]|nr:MAG: hypothetical protein M1834_001156 [Cirrosporium novae-zelandiae]